MTNDPEFRAALQLVNECLTYDVSSVSAVRALHAACSRVLDEDAADTQAITKSGRRIVRARRAQGNPRCMMNFARPRRCRPIARGPAPEKWQYQLQAHTPKEGTRRIYGCNRRRDEEDARSVRGGCDGCRA